MVTQTRGQNSRLFTPLPTTVRALSLYGEKDSELSSLVDSRRTAPTHATIGGSRQLVSFEDKKTPYGVRTHGINDTNSDVRG